MYARLWARGAKPSHAELRVGVGAWKGLERKHEHKVTLGSVKAEKQSNQGDGWGWGPCTHKWEKPRQCPKIGRREPINH